MGAVPGRTKRAVEGNERLEFLVGEGREVSARIQREKEGREPVPRYCRFLQQFLWDTQSHLAHRKCQKASAAGVGLNTFLVLKLGAGARAGREAVAADWGW
jgi:hypothetical protein